MISDTADRGPPFIVGLGVPLRMHGESLSDARHRVETCDSSAGCSWNVRIFRRA